MCLLFNFRQDTMGKKNRKQKEAAAAKLRDTDEKKLSKADEKQIMDLVTSLLESCSKPIPPGPKEIEEFDAVYDLVEKIRTIQSVVAVKQPDRTNGLQKFQEWLKVNKVDVSAVDIHKFPDLGYGLKAAKDILVGFNGCICFEGIKFELFFIPENCSSFVILK